MDFFSSHHVPQPQPSSPGSSMDSFAQEIGRRFSLPGGQPMLTSRLSPIATSIATNTTTAGLAPPQARFGGLSLKSQPFFQRKHHHHHHHQPPLEARLTPVDPASLLQFLDSPDVLVLDIRSHATFTQSRIPNALSLSVPSVLLKRPAFSLNKLTEMLPSSSGRRRFSAWKSVSRILVYDADSQAIPEGSNLSGLLRKFEIEGFHGDLAWLKGGFAGVWRERRTLVDQGPPSPDSSEEDAPEAGYLRAKKLPSSAFQQVSTTSAGQRPSMSLSKVDDRSVAPGPTSTKAFAANPFYDNIRQNRELEHGITERIPLRLPFSVLTRRDELPFDWLKGIVDKADKEEGTESLAMQFYMIELREQRRLMGVMDHHSREVTSAQDHQRKPEEFPYSITAGVEKGSKNRYTNIWPFEHARVRLKAINLDDNSDYINASYIQPLGTHRRYIATQGPLPSTYTDFWTLCWEQNIRIIVMLTKQVEGSSEKCGCYWKRVSYGPLRLELLSSSGEGEEELEVRTAPQNYFGMSSGGALDADKATVRRKFHLRHTAHPNQPPREVTQLQYLEWPDFDVPNDPRGLLNLMREVDALRAEIDAEDHPDGPPGPVLLHCSAGIGRTGGFIVIDAALDAIRREIRKNLPSTGNHLDGDANTPPPQTLDVEDHATSIASPIPMDLDVPERDKARGVSLLRGSPLGAPKPHDMSIKRSLESCGTDACQSDDSRNRSLSPGPSVPGTTSGSSSSMHGLRTSVFAADMDLRMPSPKRPAARPPRKSLVVEPEPGFAAGSVTSSLNRIHSTLMSSITSGVTTEVSSSMTNLPSIFSASLPPARKSSTATSSFPVSVESSRAPSPIKNTELLQTNTTFDYMDPRRLHNNASPDLLSSYNEPIRSMLEDMREQRMSLCQSLRQYVFVHRAIVEGALDIVDEERSLAFASQLDDSPSKGKRGPSPTELLIEDKRGAVRLSKRPSFKRRDRSDTSDGVQPR